MMHTIQADEQSFITARPSLLKLQIDALIHYQPFANKLTKKCFQKKSNAWFKFRWLLDWKTKTWDKL